MSKPRNRSLSQTIDSQLSKNDLSSLLMQEPPHESPAKSSSSYNEFSHSFRNEEQTSHPISQPYTYSGVVRNAAQKKSRLERRFNEITFDFIDQKRNNKFHRYDVDGLRGYACLLVAVFHIWVHRTSGGVDVFLTISGYFLIPSLLRKICRPTFKLRDFSPVTNIKNILRRLWPSMVVILFAVFLLGWRLMPHETRLDLLKQIAASFGFYENWYMYITGRSYLTASSTVSPLQHMWSMAIQGQFFLATILIILVGGLLIRLLVRRTGHNDAKAALWVMLGLSFFFTITSFIFAAYIIHKDPSGGYYNTYARVWEPMTGGLIGIFSNSIRLPRFLREIMSTTAVICIFVIGLIILGTFEFPGPWALVPVLSTLAIISAYNPRHDPRSMPVINQIFSGKICQWFGHISYPLYLWHWPLLIMFLNWRPYIDRPNFLQGSLILGISIAMAWLTTILVENPIRNAQPLAFALQTPPPIPRGFIFQKNAAKVIYLLDRIYRSAVIVVLATFLVIIGTTYRTWSLWLAEESKVVPTPIELYPGAKAFLDGLPVPPNQPIQPPLETARFGDLPATTKDHCINDFTSPAAPIICDHYGDIAAKRIIILAGGSHAEHWITALNDIGIKYHYKIVTILRMGCELTTDEHPLKPVPGGVAPYPECAEWEKMAIQDIIKTKPAYLFTTVTRPRPPTAENGDWVPQNYIDAFKEFRAAGIQILGMRDSPWPHALYEGRLMSPAECVSEYGGKPSSYYKCGVEYSKAFDPVNPAISALKDFPDIHLLDLTPGFCNIKRNYCPAVVGNVLVWHDDHHLSTIFVRTLEDALIKQLTPIMGLPTLHPVKTHR